jgi:SnoaL-like domain
MGASGDGSEGGALSDVALREKCVMRKGLALLAVLVILAGSSFAKAGEIPAAASSANGPRPAEDQEAVKREIARVVSSVIGWAKTKDLDLFFGSIAQDEDYISVTPGQRVIKRFEDVKQNVPFWMSPDFQYVRHELKDLEIKLARCGTVAWFYCVLDDINTYKGEPASWENARWTGVVEKRDGKWVVVSQHFSFASDK